MRIVFFLLLSRLAETSSSAMFHPSGMDWVVQSRVGERKLSRYMTSSSLPSFLVSEGDFEIHDSGS